ncbi:MAG TPA: protein kinase, partial [Gemmataceae bacterium]|nr:protein kinase [Gemmataceae bacterium]
KGIIHRDLKPANVMLMLPRTAGAGESATLTATPLIESHYGIPKIADFGLAKHLEGDAGQTRSGTILGTPSYMAPEQAEGKSKDVGPLADQYALGAILYEMLTGRPPFRGETVLDTLEQVRTQEPVPPTQLQPKVPRDLETICLKTLQKEPQKRYVDCAALAEDLRRFVHNEPIQARPVSPPERLWRWCRRNPTLAALTALVAASLLAGTVVSSIFAYRAEKNAAEAREAQAVASDQAYVALSAVSDLVSSVQSVNKLQDSPSTRELRAELTEMALKRVKEVADFGKKNTGLDARIMGAAHSQLGSIYQSQHKNDAALKEYEEAYTILAQAAKDKPASDKARGNLAVAFANLGDLQAQMKRGREIVLPYYAQALEIRKDIHDHPRNNELPRDEVNLSLAGSYQKLADWSTDPEEVRRYQEMALALQKEALQLNPESVEAQRALWKSYAWFGDAAQRQGETAKALNHYEPALKLLTDLVASHPKSNTLRIELGNVCNKVGEFYLRVRDPTKAVPIYGRALQEFEAVAKDDPGNDAARLLTEQARYGYGVVLFQNGDFKKADQSFRKLFRFCELRIVVAPEDKMALSLGMLAGARCGEHVRAAELAEVMRKQAPEDAVNLTTVASGYALCIAGAVHGKLNSQLTAADKALQKHYQTLALDALRSARKHGFRDWADVETDPDFAPLFNNPTFKAMMAEFKTSARKAAGK